MIALERLNRTEAARYLGGRGVELNPAMQSMLDDCEHELLAAATPKYLYKALDPFEHGLMVGDSIQAHLKGCTYSVISCATIGVSVDRLIREAQVTDMARAVVLDALASVAVEQLCDKVDRLIADENKGKYLTYRFSPGYGDYPVELQGEFLRLLDAPRKIGLCTNESSLLTPTKSVTSITGLSDTPIERRRSGCQSCSLRESCKFRKAGDRCEF